MLHFFRNIRKSLLKEGRVSKYLAYALGEIFLVMIGILLALQVNNWNEQRKSNALMDSRARVLLKDLQYNVQECNLIIDFADQYDSIIDRVLLNPVDSIIIENTNTLLATQTAQFFKESLMTFLEAEEQLPEKYVHLIPELKALNRLFRSQENWERITLEDREDITRNVMFTNAYDLTNSNPNRLRGELQRLASSNQFRNRVLFSYGSTFLEENAWDVTQIRASSLILLWKLKKVVEGNPNNDINDFMGKNGLTPFNAFNCDNPLTESDYQGNFRSYRMAFLFYNNTREVRYLDFLDAELNVYATEVIRPKAFHFNAYELHDEDRFEVRSGKHCLGRYRAVRNGYLIFED